MKLKISLLSLVTLILTESQAALRPIKVIRPVAPIKVIRPVTVIKRPLIWQKKLIVHRLINPENKIRIGYKVNSQRISAMIHLPVRNNNMFLMRVKSINKAYIKNIFNDAMDATINYGGDNLVFSVRNGKNITITNHDHLGKTHKITTSLPHTVRNLVGRVDINTQGNTIEISMPRY